MGKTKKVFKNRYVKGIKIILKKKETKKRKYGCERYKNFSENKKEKKSQYERDCYKNLSEVQKQRIVEYKTKL